MGKIKSAIALALITILIVGLGFMSTAVFPHGEGIHMFNNFLAMTEKDPSLGNELPEGYRTPGGGTYIGGGYTAVYYPEGVISAQEYADNLEALKEAESADPGNEEKTKAREEYEGKYDRKGSLCLEKETVYGEEGTEVSAEFKASFERAVSLLRTRVEGLHVEGARVDVRDEYTVQVTLPAYAGGTAVILEYLSYTGEFTVSFGSDQSSATAISMEEGETIRDYVKGAGVRTSNGVRVGVRFTKKGQAAVAKLTESAADTAANLYFCVGGEPIITLSSVNQRLNERTLWISGSYTETTARATALVIDSAVNSEDVGFTLTVGDIVRAEAGFGNLAVILLYVAFAVLFVGMVAFFFVRYHLLGLAHLYTSLLWVLLMIVLVWAIPFLHLGVETFLAVALGYALLSVCDLVIFERARKEYELGRTVTFSVKAAYKKSLWTVLDLHLVIALFAFVTYFIALTELGVFAFTLGLGAVLSGLGALAVNRFHWSAFMSFAGTSDRKKAAFCNFKREEEDDE